MPEFDKELEVLQREIKTFLDKAAEEKRTIGETLKETNDAIKGLKADITALEVRISNPPIQHEHKTLTDVLKENESVQRLARDRRGSAVIHFEGLQDLERKTTITSATVGSSTPGVLMFDRPAGIVPAARMRMYLRELFTSIPTQFNAIDYVKVNADIAAASPQTEASAKFENAMTFTTATANVRTIATWIPASKQVLDDMPGLEATIRSSLVYAVRNKEETQVLSGDNTGLNLNGLTTQAQAYDTGLTVASDGWEYSDIIGRAVQQIQVDNEVEPDFLVLNPAQYWGIRLAKTSYGEYIYGPPNTAPTIGQLFGLRCIPTTAMTAGYFLVGSSAATSAVIRDRMELTVEISTEHSTFFTENKVAIRAEERLALVVFRPAAYVYGAFTQSPA